MLTGFILLTAATAFVVYLKIKSASSLFQHISVEEIKAYKRGEISQDYRRQITRHISYCKKCRQLMLDTDPDDMLEHLVE